LPGFALDADVAPALLGDAVARPRPVPRPRAFVVKNGSKMRRRVSSSMPQPVSATAMTTYEPGWATLS
jgi:hypothetical protein